MTTGLVVILVQSGGFQLGEAIPIILGANIGTTFTGVIAAIGMDTYARRAAAVNTIFNIGGVLIFLPLLKPFTMLVETIGGPPGQMTAIAHLLFNVGSSVIFVFLVNQLEWLATKVIKGDQNEIIFATRHFDQPLTEDVKAEMRLVELELAHYMEVCRSMLSTVVSYIDLRTKDGLDRVEKYVGFSAYLAEKCEARVHAIAVNDHGHGNVAQLARLLRIIDYTRQSTNTQQHMATLPELLRLPDVEELTEIKAEVFGMSTYISQIYEHLGNYLDKQDRGELQKVDALNAKLAKRISDKFQETLLSKEPTADRLQSFFLGYLTKVQSIKAKLREARKLVVLYYGNGRRKRSSHSS